jgi:hypothetical protein
MPPSEAALSLTVQKLCWPSGGPMSLNISGGISTHCQYMSGGPMSLNISGGISTHCQYMLYPARDTAPSMSLKAKQEHGIEVRQVGWAPLCTW